MKERLKDAGFREQAYAQQLVQEGKFPKGITYQDLLDHGVYDSSRDEISLTVKGVAFTYKVERP